METEEYRNIFLQEKKYWLYCGTRSLVLETIKNIFPNKTDLKILDAGCGTGGLIDELKKNNSCYGIDISDEAIRYCKTRKLSNINQSTVEKIPFADNVFDIVISIDVLYHLLIESDTAALTELYRILKENGILILNLAAYEFLRSGHDKIVHTRHRYIKGELEQKVKLSGFDIYKITYRNTVFSPIVCIIRFSKKVIKNQSKSDLRALPGWINDLLIKMLILENQLIKKVNLPFGLSVFCVARKIKR